MKAKSCNKPGCEVGRWGGGFCLRHQYLRTDKKPKGLNAESATRKRQKTIYTANKKRRLSNFPKCELKNCPNDSTHIHHKGGRAGAFYFEYEFLMAVCNDCHPIKIHENPIWARENGYLI